MVIGNTVPASSRRLPEYRMIKAEQMSNGTEAGDCPAPRVACGRAVLGNLATAREREWLVTNGAGAFAAGTLAGLVSRRYHGLLVAALKPPVARTVTLVKLDARVQYGQHTFDLATNEYADGTVHPHGYRLLQDFRLDGTVPTWTWALDDALLECSIYMARQRNTTYIRYRLARSSAPLRVELDPLTAWRDYHWHQRGGQDPQWTSGDDRCEILGAGGALRLIAPGARFAADPRWHWNIRHAVEASRGLDAVEDLFRAGSFKVTLLPRGEFTFIASTEQDPPEDPAAALQSLRTHESQLLSRMPVTWPAWVRGLALAADQYVVSRKGRSPAESGSTIIAGYPWFTDWGRDTMIALPGLTLAVGRPQIARDILTTFARHVDRGVLPNRFPDGDEAPEYNTVDATLWYFQAVSRYLSATGDIALARELYPVLVDIVNWHDRGTHFNIHTADDGLLHAGETGVQLTWMDAKVDGRVITPRTGKPVEINALWHGVFRVLADVAGLLQQGDDAARWQRRAQHIEKVFGERFWNEDAGQLYDVIDTPDGRPDGSLRPNQLIACALVHPLLDRERTRRIVDTCGRALLTSYGLRSLGPDATDYIGRYRGGPVERDQAYHQGTAWAWLIGPFVRAHLRAYGNHDAARSFLAPFENLLSEACAGQYPEIFDGDAPHGPAGCFAQAWSVAEVIGTWSDVQEPPSPTQ